jgi:hypothetical protein
VPSNSEINPPQDIHSCLAWTGVLNAYGVIRPGISMIALENDYIETEIMGTITPNPDDDNTLIYSVDQDTLPLNTLDPVDSVIDPLKKIPGEGLPVAAAGQRYLIVEDIPQQQPYTTSVVPAWLGLTSGANANDIIEYDGTEWSVVFESQSTNTVEFVTNITSGIQYRYNDGVWSKSWEGWYEAGDWRIIL